MKNPDELIEKYHELIGIINKYVTNEDKRKKLLSLYDKLEKNIIIAPASSINTFHGAYAGGYLDHVINVVNCSIAQYNTWLEMGADMSTFTFEELIFSAINHDLGKVGDLDNEYYIPNTSEWHVRNQGKIFVDNPDIVNMSIPDRSLWLLQSEGIYLTQNEFLAIKLHDGPGIDENKGYYNTFQDSRKLRSSIVYILHFADQMAARIEYENEKLERNNAPKSAPVKSQPKKLSDTTANASAATLFDKMFKDVIKNHEEEN